MSFLIDTDICSAYLKGNRVVWNRFMQFTGGLHMSAITLAELNVWARRAGAPGSRLEALHALLNDFNFLEVDADVAQRYGQLQALLLDQGTPAPGMDLIIAATALVHNLTLITHNSGLYQHPWPEDGRLACPLIALLENLTQNPAHCLANCQPPELQHDVFQKEETRPDRSPLLRLGNTRGVCKITHADRAAARELRGVNHISSEGSGLARQ